MFRNGKIIKYVQFFYSFRRALPPVVLMSWNVTTRVTGTASPPMGAVRVYTMTAEDDDSSTVISCSLSCKVNSAID